MSEKFSVGEDIELFSCDGVSLGLYKIIGIDNDRQWIWAFGYWTDDPMIIAQETPITLNFEGKAIQQHVPGLGKITFERVRKCEKCQRGIRTADAARYIDEITFETPNGDAFCVYPLLEDGHYCKKCVKRMEDDILSIIPASSSKKKLRGWLNVPKFED